MSFYNLFFGVNPNADIILALIKLKRCDIDRFRDVELLDDKIVILTRTGGDNRTDYPNHLLTSNPYYLYDEDDKSDNTYAYYYFRIPDEIREDVKGLKEPAKYGISAKLVRWILETLNREETDRDRWWKNYKEQERVIHRLVCEQKAQIWNGHTVVPLCDDAFERICEVLEKNNGESLVYWIRPYKVKIIERGYKYRHNEERDENFYLACITQPKRWEIDWEIWNRWKSKFGEKYPKTISKIDMELIEERSER